MPVHSQLAMYTTGLAAIAPKKNVPKGNSPAKRGTEEDPPGKGDLAPDLNTMVKDSVVAALQSPHVVKLLTEALVESVTQAVVKKLEETLQINSAAIQRMENELKKKEEKIEELKQEMRKRSDDLEQYQRRNNLRIFGVPENKKENADAVVMNVFTKQLGVMITEADIDRSHRVGIPKEGKPRPLIVKFVSYRKRSEIFRCKRALKGTGITIREDLTHGRLQELQKAILKYGLRNVWTEDGKIVYLHQGKKVYATSIAQ